MTHQCHISVTISRTSRQGLLLRHELQRQHLPWSSTLIASRSGTYRQPKSSTAATLPSATQRRRPSTNRESEPWLLSLRARRRDQSYDLSPSTIRSCRGLPPHRTTSTAAERSCSLQQQGIRHLTKKCNFFLRFLSGFWFHFGFFCLDVIILINVTERIPLLFHFLFFSVFGCNFLVPQRGF